MYEIVNSDQAVKIKFNGNFDYSVIKTALQHVGLKSACTQLNDIWFIGKHSAQICMGELLALVDDFKHLYHEATMHKKTAFVVEHELTTSRFHLLVEGLNKGLTHECRLFSTSEEAEEWLGMTQSTMA